MPLNKPDCYSIYWEAIAGPTGDNCRKCIIKDDCLHEFATGRLVAVQAEWPGDGDPLAFFAQRLRVDEQAVLLAIAHQRGETTRPRQTPVLAEDTEPEPLTTEMVTHLRKGGLATVASDGKTWVKAERMLDPADGSSLDAIADDPPKKKKRIWGAHTHEARWLTERERNPLVAQLTPGTKIKAKFKKQTYEAIVKKGGYDYEGETYPTLRALTTAICGGSRNVAKFWRLEG